MARRAKNNFRITIDSHARSVRRLRPRHTAPPRPAPSPTLPSDGSDADANHDGKIFRAFCAQHLHN